MNPPPPSHTYTHPSHTHTAPKSHLYDRDDGGIWRSTDDGATFTRVSKLPTFTLNAFYPAKTVFATDARDATQVSVWGVRLLCGGQCCVCLWSVVYYCVLR